MLSYIYIVGLTILGLLVLAFLIRQYVRSVVEEEIDSFVGDFIKGHYNVVINNAIEAKCREIDTLDPMDHTETVKI